MIPDIDYESLPSYSPIIAGSLYQGDIHAIRQLSGIQLHVRTAVQDPPPAKRIIPCDTIYIGLHDLERDWTKEDKWLGAVSHVAGLTTEAVKLGQPVLVTCQAGLNRSGLIVALTLCALGLTPDEAIYLVRKQRSPHALFNESFVEAIHMLGPILAEEE